MIIPIKCQTCGKVIANKWQKYEAEVTAYEKKHASSSGKSKKIDEVQMPGDWDAYKGKILDDLELTKICCRRHMLGHVDLIEII
jgi:DNA-directed RNA polymerase subunit N (RpoN/RPB10)